jgi:hypothetical protein
MVYVYRKGGFKRPDRRKAERPKDRRVLSPRYFLCGPVRLTENCVDGSCRWELGLHGVPEVREQRLVSFAWAGNLRESRATRLRSIPLPLQAVRRSVLYETPETRPGFEPRLAPLVGQKRVVSSNPALETSSS